MKTKKTKSKNPTVRKPKVKKYPSHYLAIVIFCAMLIEGMLGSASTNDWQQAVKVLDVSSGVIETSQDTIMTFQPAIELVLGINEFYQQSATEMTKLLDISSAIPDLTLVFDGVNTFYEVASVQMANVLDISGTTHWPAMVAGISIER